MRVGKSIWTFFVFSIAAVYLPLATQGCATFQKDGQLVQALQVEEQILTAMATNQRFQQLRGTYPGFDAYLDEHEDELLLVLTRGVVQYVAMRYADVPHNAALDNAARIASAYATVLYGMDLTGEYAKLVEQEPGLPPTLAGALDRLIGVIVLPPLATE